MQKTRAGVVGVGQMGQYHVGIYSELHDVELVGVADTDRQRGAYVAGKYGIPLYADYHDLLGKVDVVSIAVPTSLHYPVAKTFLEAGVHVLLEKPIAHTLEEATELFRIADTHGVALHVGHVERFNGAIQELKNIVHEPWFIESRRLGPFVPRIKEDGVILDVMIHDIDIILNLVESPITRLYALGKSINSEREDLANVQLCFQNGCIANILASRSTEIKIRTMAITQRDAYIILDYTDQDIRVHRQASSEHVVTRGALRYRQESLIERIFVHKENPLKLEIQHLLDCVSRRATRVVSVEKELRSLQVALQILDILDKDGLV
ncbi:Gfo/Idh/MocA family protein [Candidatus Entotheonella palauensis]|uniref:Oxidoreductase n=1 Tax=Candidatus Entotheonella gemina TaxID=1429439 RepID=W4MFJ1_9BACT|nr:Gfo/Idh/MocA family oxidoreductase [Candidatus Entotheonella palauensis]ETX08691.1 MAG: oxidoreductase [Candidatus Entotheonella gemina]